MAQIQTSLRGYRYTYSPLDDDTVAPAQVGGQGTVWGAKEIQQEVSYGRWKEDGKLAGAST